MTEAWEVYAILSSLYCPLPSPDHSSGSVETRFRFKLKFTNVHFIFQRNMYLMLPWVVLGLVLAIGLLISVIYTSIVFFIDGDTYNGIFSLVFGIIFLCKLPLHVYEPRFDESLFCRYLRVLMDCRIQLLPDCSR